MARYRIKQRPSCATPGNAIFETEERVLLWWEYRGMHFSIEEAEQHVAEMQENIPIKTKIIKQYD
jgi:hypothetical protein